MARAWLALAAFSGFLSVALGALGAHSLKNVLDEYGKSIYEKAVTYQMFHTMGLFAVGLLQMFLKNTSLSISGWSFLTGIFLFSGSLYLLALTGVKWLGAITPFGGIAFLLGWAFLGFKIIRTTF
jgi:uncharacterized membrane protein YgdD (TMEM256/DUF423 family)